MFYLFASVLLIIISNISMQSNNACKTFKDYYNDLENNPNCFYNPDINLTVPEIIQRHGYPVENHTVLTQDGYFLTIFRIPYGKGLLNITKRPPVFLQHGLQINSVCFVGIGTKSLAFVMADNGYDVWLGNFRGTLYSSTHKFLKDTERAYWNFTITEYGIYDLPTQLNLVFKITQQKIFYIGHSLGTTAYYVFNSENPKEANKIIRFAISLAPIGFLNHITSPLKILTTPLIYTVLKEFLEITTDGVVQQMTPVTISTMKLLCLPYPIQMEICSIPDDLFAGLDLSQQDPTTFPVTLITYKDAVCIKVLFHFVQFVQTGKFQKYDYGKRKNKILYGTTTPPQYNLSNINIPNYFIRGNGDLIATKKNVDKTYAALPALAKPFNIYLVKYNDFTHTDFLIAKDVQKILYNHIVKFLKVNGEQFQ